MSMWSEPSWLFLVDPMSGSVTEGSGTGDRWLLLLWWWLIREPRLAAEMFLGKGELCSFSSLGWLREGEKGSQRVRDTRRDCEGSCVDLLMDRWRYGKWCRIKTSRLSENKPMQTDQNSHFFDMAHCIKIRALPVLEEKSTENIGSVLSFDLVWDDHLLHHLMGNTRKSLLVQIQKHSS